MQGAAQIPRTNLTLKKATVTLAESKAKAALKVMPKKLFECEFSNEDKMDGIDYNYQRWFNNPQALDEFLEAHNNFLEHFLNKVGEEMAEVEDQLGIQHIATQLITEEASPCLKKVAPYQIDFLITVLTEKREAASDQDARIVFQTLAIISDLSLVEGNEEHYENPNLLMALKPFLNRQDIASKTFDEKIAYSANSIVANMLAGSGTRKDVVRGLIVESNILKDTAKRLLNCAAVPDHHSRALSLRYMGILINFLSNINFLSDIGIKTTANLTESGILNALMYHSRFEDSEMMYYATRCIYLIHPICPELEGHQDYLTHIVDVMGRLEDGDSQSKEIAQRMYLILRRCFLTDEPVKIFTVNEKHLNQLLVSAEHAISVMKDDNKEDLLDLTDRQLTTVKVLMKAHTFKDAFEKIDGINRLKALCSNSAYYCRAAFNCLGTAISTKGLLSEEDIVRCRNHALKSLEMHLYHFSTESSADEYKQLMPYFKSPEGTSILCEINLALSLQPYEQHKSTETLADHLKNISESVDGDNYLRMIHLSTDMIDKAVRILDLSTKKIVNLKHRLKAYLFMTQCTHVQSALIKLLKKGCLLKLYTRYQEGEKSEKEAIDILLDALAKPNIIVPSFGPQKWMQDTIQALVPLMKAEPGDYAKNDVHKLMFLANGSKLRDLFSVNKDAFNVLGFSSLVRQMNKACAEVDNFSLSAVDVIIAEYEAKQEGIALSKSHKRRLRRQKAASRKRQESKGSPSSSSSKSSSPGEQRHKYVQVEPYIELLLDDLD